MPATQADCYRPLKSPQAMPNRLFQKIVLGGIDTLDHIAEDDSLHTLQPSGVTEVQQQPVPLVRLRSNVFQKQNAPLKLRRIRRA